MQVEDLTNKCRVFGDLEKGTPFFHNGELYIKTETFGESKARIINAINVTNGKLAYFSHGKQISTPQEAKVVVRR